MKFSKWHPHKKNLLPVIILHNLDLCELESCGGMLSIQPPASDPGGGVRHSVAQVDLDGLNLAGQGHWLGQL